MLTWMYLTPNKLYVQWLPVIATTTNLQKFDVITGMWSAIFSTTEFYLTISSIPSTRALTIRINQGSSFGPATVADTDLWDFSSFFLCFLLNFELTFDLI